MAALRFFVGRTSENCGKPLWTATYGNQTNALGLEAAWDSRCVQSNVFVGSAHMTAQKGVFWRQPSLLSSPIAASPFPSFLLTPVYTSSPLLSSLGM